jgi:probable phosphoglycerate mutase
MIQGCDRDNNNAGKKSIPVKNVTRVFVIRHAQAYKNLSPSPDLPKEKLDSLTPDGQKQAESLGLYLNDKDIKKIFSSPVGRTRETATIIAKKIHYRQPISIEKSLLSLKKGTTPQGDQVTWQWRIKQWQNGKDPRPNGGESLKDGQKRVISWLSNQIKSFPGQNIAFVTHGDICPAVLAYAAGDAPDKAIERQSVDIGSVSEILIQGEQWQIANKNYLPIGD